MSNDYTKSKQLALKTILVLAGITVGEVMIALTGKGYIIEGVHWPWYLMGVAMISLSLYKAYLIVGEFMHLKHEVRAMGMTVVLPTLLLVWAIIAFMYEGGAWKNNREKVEEKNKIEIQSNIHSPQGMLIRDSETKSLN